MEKSIRLGAINWDAGLLRDTYFGGYMIRSLGDPNHAHRLPYYAKIDDHEKYYIPERTFDDYNRELQMAVDGGIDFFLYCWYPDGTEPRDIGTEANPELAEHFPSLNTMRKLYQQSPLREKIQMCAILITPHAYSRKDLETLISTMQEDYYEKKDGRPLVFLFGGYRLDFIHAIREVAEEAGIDPYIVFMNNGRGSDNGDYTAADAVSTYASCHSAETYEALCAAVTQDNEKRKAYGIPVMPTLSVGWNPEPRIDHPCPWVQYSTNVYAPLPTADQMEKATLDYFRWIEENDEASTGYGVIFAWNEFEEGGYLCPTLGEDGKPHTAVLDGFQQARQQYQR